MDGVQGNASVGYPVSPSVARCRPAVHIFSPQRKALPPQGVNQRTYDVPFIGFKEISFY